MENKIQLETVFREGFANGMKNLPSLLGAIVLWILTLWIPFVNVGTTIAICTLPVLMSKGEVFSPLDIFNKKYYRYMGEFFLTSAFMYLGIIAGAIFLIIPGIVIFIAWSQAIYLVLDKGLNAAEAIRLSNKITFGNKWRMFAIKFILGIVFSICIMIFVMIIGFLAYISPVLGSLIGIILILCLAVAFMAINLGCSASIYGTLSKDIEEQH